MNINGPKSTDLLTAAGVAYAAGAQPATVGISSAAAMAQTDDKKSSAAAAVGQKWLFGLMPPSPSDVPSFSKFIPPKPKGPPAKSSVYVPHPLDNKVQTASAAVDWPPSKKRRAGEASASAAEEGVLTNKKKKPNEVLSPAASATAAIDIKTEGYDSKDLKTRDSSKGKLKREHPRWDRPDNKRKELDKYSALEKQYKTFFSSPTIEEIEYFDKHIEGLEIYDFYEEENLFFTNDRTVGLDGVRGYAICLQGINKDNGKPENLLTYCETDFFNETTLEDSYDLIKDRFKAGTIKFSVIGGCVPYSSPEKFNPEKKFDPEHDESYEGSYEEEVIILKQLHNFAQRQGIECGARLHYSPEGIGYQVLVFEGQIYCSHNHIFDPYGVGYDSGSEDIDNTAQGGSAAGSDDDYAEISDGTDVGSAEEGSADDDAKAVSDSP